MRSLVVWRGPSALADGDVQVVLTGLSADSRNGKTGSMVQASIMIPGTKPSMLFGTDRERAVCGDCPLRGRLVTETAVLRPLMRQPRKWLEPRVCYAWWAAWLLGQHAHKYSHVSLVEGRVHLAGKKLRLGSYGDPAAVPFDVWNELLADVPRWTAYTHAWESCDPRFRYIAMASVETLAGYLEAQRRGWRTFRTKLAGTPLYPNEVKCPARSVRCDACRARPYPCRRCLDNSITCERCGLCCGKSILAKNIVIDAHGSGAGGLVEIVQGRLPLAQEGV